MDCSSPQLSAKRFVNVRSFNGKVLVDIREYYNDDSGERKPGKKGEVNLCQTVTRDMVALLFPSWHVVLNCRNISVPRTMGKTQGGYS